MFISFTVIMGRRLLLLLFLLPLCTFAQQHTIPVLLTRDSLPLHPTQKLWRFSPADLPNGADTALDDSQWPLVECRLSTNEEKKPGNFNGICWLRLHIVVDSTVADQPLALALWQFGASEFYLDGKLICSFGVIKGRDSTMDYDPGRIAAVFTAPAVGTHVLAVRYANYHWLSDARNFNRHQAGFRMDLAIANTVLPVRLFQFAAQHWLFILFFSFFLAFTILHLLLFLFHRSDKSNLWFSIFCLSVSLLFLAFYMIGFAHSPQWQMNFYWITVPLICVACCTMSGLINWLFMKGRLRFYIIAGCCVALLILHLFEQFLAITGVIVLVSVVALEAVIVVVYAMVRRVRGARIVGIGILFFCVLLLFIYMLFIATGGNYQLNDNNPAGTILFFALFISILSIPISMSAYLAWNFSHISRDLSKQLIEVERLSAHALEAEAEKQRILEARQEELEREVAERTSSLRAEKQKSDNLLRNILPAEVAEELKENGRSEARLYNDVSVLFTDFVDFTQSAEQMTPSELVAEVDACFRAFDDIIEEHGLEKIKTVGDAYIAAAGMPAENPAHASDAVAAAIAIRDFIRERKKDHPQSFDIRIGVHSGPVVAGIVGVKKFAYDIWGDTVNTAARMEQHSEAGKINISTATYHLVKGSFQCAFRGELEAKHKGKMGMYFVEQ
jgi:class 3 adenylate cyclase